MSEFRNKYSKSDSQLKKGSTFMFMMMTTVARRLLGSAKLMFGFCSHLPIRLELRMTREEEERMVISESEYSNSYRREEVHIRLEG